MNAEKLSVSLDPSLVQFVNQYKQSHNISTKSEVVSLAIRALRNESLQEQYMYAHEEWLASADQNLLDATLSDGLGEDAGFAEDFKNAKR